MTNILWAWLILGVGRAADLWATYEGLHNRIGVKEANPIMRYLIEKIGLRGAIVFNIFFSVLIGAALFAIPPMGLWPAVFGVVSLGVGIWNWERIKNKPKV